MRTLIIGATGYIGKIFVKNTSIRNYKTTSSKKKNKHIKFNLLKDSIEDIIENYQIKKVIFFSAISNPNECEKNKRKSNLINVKYTIKALKQLIKKNIYFIFFSTEYVFDGLKGNYKENSKVGNRLLYAKQKVKVEKFLKKQKYKNFAILRIAKTFGRGKNDRTIFTECVKNLKKKKTIFVAKDQYFRALYVDDLIKVIDIFIKKKIKGIYNTCGDEKFSRYQYFEKIQKRLNINNKLKAVKFVSVSSNKNIPLNVTMNNNKLKKKIDFKFTKFDKYLSYII